MTEHRYVVVVHDEPGDRRMDVQHGDGFAFARASDRTDTLSMADLIRNAAAQLALDFGEQS